MQLARRKWLLVFLPFLFLHISLYAQDTIPVVVHIVSDDPDAVSDADIINAINDLNDAFAHAGPYSAGKGANTGIRFCLARTDPDGGITNGITRTRSVYNDFDSELEDARAKQLISWDTRRYANIWYVKGLKSEIYPSFACGQWTRMKEAGYATFSGGGDFKDGIVVTGFGVLLAHEMGHYLGLKHTFSINSCINNDCSVDGDGICDTPPQSVPGGSCTDPQNSCFTDTLSGFAKDTVDMNANFMSYSGCANLFTEGQAQRMRENLASVRSSLLASKVCEPPCGAAMAVRFTRDQWMPTPGTTVNFTATATGASNYQWSVDGVVSGSNSPLFSYTFSALGKYKVSLRVNNGDPSCSAIYSHFVIVNCGVLARFYPDKRLIASKDPILVDTILFTNRSENATSFKWLMSNDAGMAETVVSTDRDLQFPFKVSGKYMLRLIASNGSCADTTETMKFTVEDPTVNGTITLRGAQCYNETKVQLQFFVCNQGYATIPPGTPISFYSGDPRTAGAVKLDTTFLMPDPVFGKCCGQLYTMVLDMKRYGADTLYAVFNDRGTAVPIALPNAPLVESNYADNVSRITGFRFRSFVTPIAVITEPGDTIRLAGRATQPIAELRWSSLVPGLSCTVCPAPVYVTRRADDRVKMEATSALGCSDSAFVDIKVPPADDLTLKVRSLDCYKEDSVLITFDICNSFRRPVIPKGIKVAFYDGAPGAGGVMMGQPFVVPVDAVSSCVTYSNMVKVQEGRKIFMVVNGDSLLLEKDHTNNTVSLDYIREKVQVLPSDTSVLRNELVRLVISSPIYDPSSLVWTAGGGVTLDCINCASPVATVKNTDSVRVHMKSRYGCEIKGGALLKVLPPDMTVEVLSNECYSNTTTRVRFRICMNNGYDAVFRGIPVSFYDADPTKGTARKMEPTFYTTRISTTSCDTFSAIISTPSGSRLYAVVNDRGAARAPDTLFNETDLANNVGSDTVNRFRIDVSPQDTIVYRNSSIRLLSTVSGGNARSFEWWPERNISCIACPAPTVRVPYTQTYIVTATNKNGCTASDTAIVRMYTDGPVNIPNAFTPNGDGRNDVFYVLGTKDIVVVKSFEIYDRFGQQVFKQTNVPPNDPVYGWNGQVKTGSRSSDSFVYVVVVRFNDGAEVQYKGTVTVIR